VPLAAAAAAAADAEDDSEADERLVLAEDDCDELDIQPCTYTHTHIYTCDRQFQLIVSLF